MPPSPCRLFRFLALTQPLVRLVIANTITPGTSAAAPSFRFSDSRKTAAPVIMKILPMNCISAWEMNWLSLSVSLFKREIRSPALF